jgi:ubiquinone/menaquinone biosynthesis C-methylase UbiE
VEKGDEAVPGSGFLGAGQAARALVDLVESGTVTGQVALDIREMGSNTLYLARTGFSVTGMDISPEAVKYAGRRARKEKLKVSLVACDFTQMLFVAAYLICP